MIITFTNQKGGVGKTTSAVNAAHGLARWGLNTILADLDPQGHAAILLGLDPGPGVFGYFVADSHPLVLLAETNRPNLRLLPGNSRTKTAQTVCQSEPDGLIAATTRLRHLATYSDALVLDTPASGIFQEAAIQAADVVVVPVRLEALSLDGVAATMQVVARLNPHAIVRILPTALDRRVNEHGANLTLLRVAYQGQVAAYIPQRIAVAEAAAVGQTIWEYASNGVLEAYQDLIDWLIAEVQHGQ